MMLRRLISPVIVLAVLVALGWTIQNIKDAPDRLARLERRAKQFRELDALSREQAADRVALEQFAGLENATPVSLAALVRESFGGATADVHQRGVQELMEGWRLRRMDVTLDSVALSSIGEFITRCEQQRPPWRLTECLVVAGAQSGQGRVTLLLEGLEKQEGKAP
jgi:hypothetical protein